MTDKNSLSETTEETDSENKPELIKQTEDFFYLFQHNITQDAKNTVWQFLNLAKQSYPESDHKKEWNLLLQNLQALIDDFHNDISAKSELKLAAMHRNALELSGRESRPLSEQEPESVPPAEEPPSEANK